MHFILKYSLTPIQSCIILHYPLDIWNTIQSYIQTHHKDSLYGEIHITDFPICNYKSKLFGRIKHGIEI